MNEKRSLDEFAQEVRALHDELEVLLDKHSVAVQGAALDIHLSSLVARIFISKYRTEEELEQELDVYCVKQERALRNLIKELQQEYEKNKKK